MIGLNFCSILSNADPSEVINVFYSDNERKFVVKVKKCVAGKIYGHLWSNLRTAEKIIKKNIRIEAV